MNGTRRTNSTDGRAKRYTNGSYKSNLAFLREYFDIKSVSPHGGKFNYMLDQSDEWLQLSKDVGVISAYHLPYDVYLTDPSLVHLKSVLELQKPGSLVELLSPPRSIKRLLIV